MGRLIVSEFVTLDGVMEDPGGAEGTPGGGWAFQFDRGPGGDAFKAGELESADALLLGRRTYEGFAEAWPSRGGDPFSDKMNAMPKHVVASRPLEPAWENSSALQGELEPAVRELKARYRGDVLVAGSATLARGLLGAGLVDELRLMVFPVVLGQGRRLFADAGGAGTVAMRLLASQPAGDCVILTFGPRQEA